MDRIIGEPTALAEADASAVRTAFPSNATVAEILATTVARLGRQLGAREDALQLLAHVLDTSTTNVLMRVSQPFPSDAAGPLDRLLVRAQAGEPLAYLLGWTDFADLRFAVDRSVLIPRPETERLVSWAGEWLDARLSARAGAASGAFAWRARQPALSIVDVGTGSGAIVVSLARRYSVTGCRWLATDVSAEALAVAKANAARLAPRAEIGWFHGDLLPARPIHFDLVLANLPYVGTDELADVQDSVLNFEPHVALFGGPAGLDHIGRLIRLLPTRLAPGGAAALEIGWQQGEAVRSMIEAALPGATVNVHQDWSDLDRLVTIET